MAEQRRVMISSTARDLPEHRKEVMDACLQVVAVGAFVPTDQSPIFKLTQYRI